MTVHPIEPGLLRLFRWFVGIRLGLLVLLALFVSDPAPDDPVFVLWPGFLFVGILFVYLNLNALPELLGRWFLPLALWLITIGTVIENAVNVQYRLQNGATANEAVADYWLYFFYLIVPLIVVAWQYRYRWVVLFSVGTFVLDGALVASPLEETGADAALLGALMLGRMALFLLVGLVIAKLVKAQRNEREALAAGAITRERLAMSEERRRLARELHDTLAHTLSAVAVQLEGATTVWDDDNTKAREMVDRSLESTRSGLAEARRAITALRSASVEEQGLADALADLCSSVNTQTNLTVSLAVDGDGPDDPDIQHTVYRIATEALTNAVRHAEATIADVALAGGADSWQLTIADNGRGFDPSQSQNGDSHGLLGMAERAEMIDADLVVSSTPGGTTVVLGKGQT